MLKATHLWCFASAAARPESMERRAILLRHLLGVFA
jgi:hypothetical protein